MKTFNVTALAQTDALASALAALMPEEAITLHLLGDLGAGKTAFARCFIHALGYSGAVRSPTYNIVQIYDLGEERQRTLYHFDLYRLTEPEELEALGVRDYFQDNSLAVIEWPEKGQGALPDPDLTIEIRLHGESRRFTFHASSEKGHTILQKLDCSLLD